MSYRYKITATIVKPGNPPVNWVRYSENKMTRKECEKIFIIPKKTRSSFAYKVKVSDFQCVMIAEKI
ncbi:TPA: DUF1187 family protein [Klebsiella pneumoniae]|nr:DUF1187 family protein [Klebsiella pneumoniae]